MCRLDVSTARLHLNTATWGSTWPWQRMIVVPILQVHWLDFRERISGIEWCWGSCWVIHSIHPAGIVSFRILHPSCPPFWRGCKKHRLCTHREVCTLHEEGSKMLFRVRCSWKCLFCCNGVVICDFKNYQHSFVETLVPPRRPCSLCICIEDQYKLAITLDTVLYAHHTVCTWYESH